MKKNFVVIENRGAGKIWINSYFDHELWSNDNPNGLTLSDISGKYGNIVFEGTEEECQRYMQEAIEESKIWVLFINNIDGDAFIREWKLGDGAYQQLRPYTAMGEFESEQDALEALKDYRKRLEE